MQKRTLGRCPRIAAILALSTALTHWVPAEDYRGLWVGQVTLNRVNEVSIPLDEDNVAIAPDPNRPTPTADAAHLRLILHVNGAGQTHLLKEVAVLNRVEGNTEAVGGTTVVDLGRAGSTGRFAPTPAGEGRLALITDETLYPEFPAQVAHRIASAVFDFGESRATDAVTAVVEAAVGAVVGVVDPRADLAGLSAQTAMVNAATQAAQDATAPVVAHAEVAESFNAFRREHLTSTVLDAAAESANPTGALSEARVAAEALEADSFYGDARGVAMVDSVVKAIEGAATPELKRRAARRAAAAFADTANDYQRFIAGALFSEMIDAAASTGATAAVAEGASETTIRAAVGADSAVLVAQAEALRQQVAEYEDQRASEAVDQTLEAVIASVVSHLPAVEVERDLIAAEAAAAGRNELATAVSRYPVVSQTPTPDYNGFVKSETYQASADIASEAAAEGAVFEVANNPLATQQSVRNAAKVAAAEALRDVYAAAARAVRNELPLDGEFAPGSGDTRFEGDILPMDSPLGPPGLTGTIHLPANHPTNPFRHRRHPDHTVGFDITRNLRLDFDIANPGSAPRAGFGVDRITGVYREEIHGLHKPLGPDPDAEPIGLKVEGTFELNRISLIDTMNAR